MHLQRLLVIIAAWLVVAAPVLPATAQDVAAPAATQPAGRSSRGAPNDAQQIVRLARLNADDALSLLKNAYPMVRRGHDPASNSIVIVGEPGPVEKAAALLRELDAEAPAAAPEVSATLSALHMGPGGVHELVKTLGLVRSRFVLDETARKIFVRGPAEEVAELTRAIEDMGSASAASAQVRPLRLAFEFLEGRVDSPSPPRASPAPPAAPASPIAPKLAEKLRQPVAIRIENVALQEALAQLADQAKVDIVVAWNDLESVGIERESPVTLTITAPAPFSDVLGLLLEQATDSSIELGFAPYGGILKIGTQSYLNRALITEIYDLSAIFGTKITEHRDRIGDLHQLLYSAIDPDSWQNNGGEATISLLGDQLVIKQSPAAHAQIAELLTALGARWSPQRAGCPVAGELKAVIDELANNGVHELSAIASLVVRARPGEHFDISGHVRPSERTLRVAVTGQAHRATETDRILVEIEAQVSDQSGDLFTVNTQVTAKLGDHVVLATSPGVSGSNRAMALAVHVTEEE